MLALLSRRVIVSRRYRSVRSRAVPTPEDDIESRVALRAHTQALNALRETQLELEQKVNGLDEKVSRLDEKVTQGFGTLATGMAQITALLTPNAGSGQS